MNKEGDKIIEEIRELFKRMEETIPEGYVKVVRCMDCKYYEGHYCWRQMKTYLARVSDMDYCSKGDRRDDSETNTD